MKIETVSESENLLQKRREIIANLEYDGATTSKSDLQKLIADQFKVSIDSVEITKILSEVGRSKGKAWIRIWKEKKIPLYSELKKEKKAKPAEAKEEKPKEEPKKEEKKE
jgi:ribosomal protein S24E